MTEARMKRYLLQRERRSRMRILVCGDRDWTDRDAIKRELSKYVGRDVTIIHGDNGYDARGRALWGKPDALAVRGADKLAGQVADELGFGKEIYSPHWKLLGKVAGISRNRRMLDAAPDLVLAFHPNLACSTGTKDMVYRSAAAEVETEVFSA